MYHPDYGYPDTFRLRVCKTAFLLGKRHAAKRHKVSLSSVYNWTKMFPFDAVMRSN